MEHLCLLHERVSVSNSNCSEGHQLIQNSSEVSMSDIGHYSSGVLHSATTAAKSISVLQSSFEMTHSSDRSASDLCQECSSDTKTVASPRHTCQVSVSKRTQKSPITIATNTPSFKMEEYSNNTDIQYCLRGQEAESRHQIQTTTKNHNNATEYIARLQCPSSQSQNRNKVLRQSSSEASHPRNASGSSMDNCATISITAQTEKRIPASYSSSSTSSSISSSSPSFFPSRWLGLNIGMWFRLLVSYTVMAASLHPVSARPSTDAARMYKNLQMKTVKYLAQFGYLEGPSSEAQHLTSGDEIKRAIKALQRAGGLPETGVVGTRLSELLLKPRCGNKDEYINEGRYSNYKFRSTADRQTGGAGTGNNDYYSNSGGRSYSYRRKRALSRQKRYTTANTKWKHTNLTFRFNNYTPDLPEGQTRRIISDALRVWSDATPLSFSEVRQSEADIMIQFASKYHSDGYPFDGQGMVLAHAFFPGTGKGGDTHFDDDENWAVNHTDGVDLLVVAAHEFGHALGLAHSGNPEALMYPWYMGFEGRFKLPRDDILGITSLYGSKEKNRVIPKTPTTKDGVVMIPKQPYVPRRNPRPDYDVSTPKVTDENGPTDPCKSHIDAMTVFRTELFIFIGKWFWRLDKSKTFTKPVEIHTFWYGLPKDLQRIDAVYERPDSKLVMFSGDRYWVFNANHLNSGFPREGRPITEFNIPADVKKIDAAFVWGYNKRTYLVSGDMYWKMNEDNRFVEYDYPRDMGTWKGVPVPVDAAYRDWNGKTYFFKGLEFSEFYDMKMQVRKGYPKVFSRHMFNCPKSKEEQLEGTNNYEVENGVGSPLLEGDIDGSSSRLRQDDTNKAISPENSSDENKDPEGLAPLSVSSSLSLLVTTLLMCIFANKLATTEL